MDYVNSNRTAKAREPSNLFDGLLTDRLTNNRINSAIGTEMKPESNDLLIYSQGAGAEGAVADCELLDKSDYHRSFLKILAKKRNVL